MCNFYYYLFFFNFCLELTLDTKIGRKLFECIINEDVGTAIQLLCNNNRAGLEYLDKYANSPLLMACYLGRNDFIPFFLKIGANYKRINILGKISIFPHILCASH